MGTLGLCGGCPGGPAPALGGILRARPVLCPGGPESLGSRVKNALSPEGRTLVSSGRLEEHCRIGDSGHQRRANSLQGWSDLWEQIRHGLTRQHCLELVR